MRKHLLTAAFALLAALPPATAQKIKLQEGSLAPLNGISKLNIQYDYSDMSVGKFDKEADYLEKKKADYNKDEAGKGDRWEASWKNDRAARFEPQFEELFNKYGAGLTVGKYPSEKYTLVFKTTFTEPGFNVHVMRKNALINAEVLIIETASPSTVIARLSLDKSPGRTFGGYDYDTGERIQEAYAAAGKALAKYFEKERN